MHTKKTLPLAGALCGLVSALACVAAVVGCPNPNTPTGTYEAGAAPPPSAVAATCTHLLTLGCADIDAGSCFAGLTNLFASQEGAPPDLACFNAAKTKAAVRACNNDAGAGSVEPCP
jgi:hypothetical protein